MNGLFVPKYTRVYLDGRDFSGYARSISGPIGAVFDTGVDDPFSASLKGAPVGRGSISPGTVTALFDNTSGMADLADPTQFGVDYRYLMYAFGSTAVPAIGGTVFGGYFKQTGFQVSPADNPTSATVSFAGAAVEHVISIMSDYICPWGVLVHDNDTETAANSDDGFDSNAAGQTSVGGWMMYQVTAAVGTGDIVCTIKIQDCDTVDGSYGDLLSTGAINLGSSGTYVPAYGIVTLAHDADVEQYLRWQIVAGDGFTSADFVLAFFRNTLE
jgi:hypothetical protein